MCQKTRLYMLLECCSITKGVKGEQADNEVLMKTLKNPTLRHLGYSLSRVLQRIAEFLVYRWNEQILEGIPKAKAAIWVNTNAESRKLGEQIRLETGVVLAVNVVH